MRTAVPVASAAFCLALFAQACSPDLKLASSDVIACGAKDLCPRDWTCVDHQRCVEPTAVDSLGAGLLSPTDNAAVSAEAVHFAWAPVQGASLYTIDVARDSSFADHVAGFPRTLAEFELTAAVDPGTYFWRVVSDVTRAANVDRYNSFGALSGSIYVHCAEADACAAPAGDDEIGTTARPFRSIARALKFASLTNRAVVNVASRGDGLPYGEVMIVPPGISIYGGFDQGFTVRSGRTPISVEGVALQVSNVNREATRVEGFVFESTATTGASTVVALYRCSENLEIRNIGVNAPLLRTEALTVDVTPDLLGPLLADSELTAAVPAGSCTQPECAVVRLSDAGALRLEGTTIRARADYGSTSAVYAGTAPLVLRNVLIDMEGDGSAYGVSTNEVNANNVPGNTIPPTSVVIEDSVIDVHAASSFAAQLSGVGKLVLVRSTLRARGFFVNGLVVTLNDLGYSDFGMLVANNVIEASGTVAAFGVILGAKAGLIVSNTIVVGPASQFAVGLELDSSYPRVLNNLVISTGHACSDPFVESYCSFGLSEGGFQTSTAFGQPIAFAGNVFVGFGIDATSCTYAHDLSHFDHTPGTCQSDLNDPRATAAAFVPNLVTKNVTRASLSAVGLSGLVGPDGLLATADDILRPSAAGVAGLGYDTKLETCTATTSSNLLDDYLTAPSFVAPVCGSVSTDKDGRMHPDVPAVGAYEP